MINGKQPLSEREASMYSPLTLAYLGDGVYEMLVRETLVMKENKPNGKLHSEASRFVSAKGQSDAFAIIEPMLTEDEIAVFKRGRNAHSMPNKNNNLDEYKRATGFEALFGYLWLTGAEKRIEELFEAIINSEK